MKNELDEVARTAFALGQRMREEFDMFGPEKTLEIFRDETQEAIDKLIKEGASPKEIKTVQKTVDQIQEAFEEIVEKHVRSMKTKQLIGILPRKDLCKATFHNIMLKNRSLQRYPEIWKKFIESSIAKLPPAKEYHWDFEHGLIEVWFHYPQEQYTFDLLNDRFTDLELIWSES